ncbi:MAG: SH3 domain-containing protein [Thermomicrobiales bacterium]|nr:SH3 domain-containing protein [Thermomicrobiales bacterium]
MSYQPEERYWTDYLRIALPVLGLLLLIGLLWYWASALIGRPSDQPPTPNVIAEVTPINQATPPQAPTATAVVIAPTPGLPQPTPTAPAAVIQVATEPAQPPVAAQPTPPVAAEPTQEPPTATEAPSECLSMVEYEPGTVVETTDPVNLREGATTDSPVVVTLDPGTRVQIDGAYTEAGECDWAPVTALDTGQSGFIRQDFLRFVPQ